MSFLFEEQKILFSKKNIKKALKKSYRSDLTRQLETLSPGVFYLLTHEMDQRNMTVGVHPDR